MPSTTATTNNITTRNSKLQGIGNAMLAGLCAALSSLCGKLLQTSSVHFLLLNIVCTFLMIGLQGRALLHLSSLVATAINASANFVLSALLGHVFFHESLDMRWWLGTSLVMVGVVLIMSELYMVTKEGDTFAHVHENTMTMDETGDAEKYYEDAGIMQSDKRPYDDDTSIVVEDEEENTSEEPKNLPKVKLIMLASSCFFVVVATVLGTGILALPVKVSKSGFWPFFSSFFFCLIAQLFIIAYMVELLQRTQSLQEEKEKELRQNGFNTLEDETAPATVEETPRYGSGEEAIGMETDETPYNYATDTIITTHEEHKKKKKNVDLGILSAGPDLHSMGLFFLDYRIMRYVFEFAVLIHFISILISYSLGGTLAYAQFFNIMDYHTLLIAPFVISLALIVVLLQKFIQQIISVVTIIKGSLLVLMVILVGAIGFQIGRESSDAWLDIGNPFLISTVALGGSINTLPIIYSKIKNPSKQTIRWFRFGAMGGIVACWLLNVLWVLFILKIVPQTGPRPSLEYSNENGEISTISLIEIIQRDFPQFNWLAIIVQIFIMISITVSFITISSGLKHMLDGYVKSFKSAIATTDGKISQITAWVECKSPKGVISKATLQPLILQFSLYFIFFAFILVIAFFNPKSFLAVMEVFTSASLNMESGLFIAVMLFRSRRIKKYQHLKIPLPLSKYAAITIWPVAAYFLFACCYAQYIAIVDFIM